MPKARRGLWKNFPLRSEHNWLNIALLTVPVAIVLHLVHASPLLVFVFAALAIIPLAGILGEATEVLSAYAGPTMGGILNATMGNATEYPKYPPPTKKTTDEATKGRTHFFSRL